MSIESILTAESGRKRRKRVGRGAGSGVGKTCGRGHKGAGSRSGTVARPLFEGGQMPFWMRLPIRGFSNARHRVSYQPVDLKRAIDRIKGPMTIESLIEAGLARKQQRIKLVAGYELSSAVEVHVHKVTTSVRSAIEAAGGKVEEIDA